MNMMKIILQYNWLCVAAASLFLAGCGNEHPAPPSERNELVIRFFDSMKNHDAAAASEQGMKLQAMDSGNDYVSKLVTIQQSNLYIDRAQKALNAGDAAGAVAALDEGLKRYPLNHTLSQLRNRVRILKQAPGLLQAMRTAESSAAKSAALSAASTVLAGNMTPELTAYFEAYRAGIAAQAERERTRAAAEPSVPAVKAPPASPAPADSAAPVRPTVPKKPAAQ